MIQTKAFSALAKSAPLLGLLPIAIGCISAGMLLALFQAPALLCLSIYLITLYLAWQSLDALFLSELSLTLLLGIAVALRPWPDQWDAFSAWNYPRLWALTLLGLWVAAAGWMWVLALVAQVWQQRGDSLWRFSFAAACAATMTWGWSLMR